MTSPLRDYQAECVAQAFHTIGEFGGFYVQHDPGMGKTLTAIGIARMLDVHRIVVVCPPIALGVWPREMDKWWKIRTRVEVRTVSYDSLSDPVPVEGPRRKLGRSRLESLIEWVPELLILDEAHYVKSPSSNRTRAVMKLANSSIYRLALSGTPMHDVMDLWAQYRMLVPDEPLFKQTFTSYRNELVVLGGPNMNWPMKDKKTGGLKLKPGAQDAITNATVTYTHVATADMMQLPEPVETIIPFQLGNTERDAYDDMERLLRAELPDGTEADAEIVLTKLLRLTQISAGHVSNTQREKVLLGDSRIQASAELIRERPNQKIVIACRFTHDIERWVSLLNAEGRPLARIDGSTLPRYRTHYEEWFQSDRSPKNAVMLLQYQAGGTAITLHASHTLMLYTLDLSVIRYRQMIGRIWRLGQRGLCEVLVPVAEGTQDETAYLGLKSGDNNRLANLLLKRLRAQ